MSMPQHPKHAKPLVEALFHAGISRSRMRPEVDLCPHALLGMELYRYGAIIEPSCYEASLAAAKRQRLVYVENDPRDLDRQAHAGLILPEGLQ